MQDLTFGEQVKIILSRKDMTIKELAKKIEARTGRKMSRQNLTQRLGRDNFQERDMRMIAEILGCPFQLNILDERTITESEAQAGQKLKVTTAPKTTVAEKEIKAQRDAAKEQEEAKSTVEEKEPRVSAHERDITIGELVDIHEELDALMEQTAGKHLTGTELEAKLDELHKGEESVRTEEMQKDVSGDGEETAQPGAADHSDADNLLAAVRPPEGREEEKDLGDAKRNPADHPDERGQENIPADTDENHREVYQADTGYDEEEGYEDGTKGLTSYEGAADSGPADFLQRETESEEEIEKKETAQEEKPHGWRAYLKQRLKKFGKDQSHPEKDPPSDGLGERSAYPDLESKENCYSSDDYPKGDDLTGEYEEFQIEGAYSAGAYEGGYSEMEYADGTYEEEYRAAEYSEEAYLEGLPGDDEEVGEINPYTGKEYESNSVRMHPSRIGYVQVYDRMNHQWTDMTEWAFLGYQERKKQLLGRDYDPPIYLD